MMSNNLSYLANLIYSNFIVISMLAYAGGCAICLIHRRLSSWLLLMAAGFAGIFSSEALTSISFSMSNLNPDLMNIGLIAVTVLRIISEFLLVFGLSFLLVQIRRQVALSLEPTHVRR
jgi:hypothetical protein